MGWKTIPNTGGWEVRQELTWDGRRLFRFMEIGGPARKTVSRRWKLLDRLNDFFNSDFRDKDPRIGEQNGELSVAISLEPGDFKLFCTPIDYYTFNNIKRYWQRDAWRETEEQRLMDKCLHELHERGKLKSETFAELDLYKEFLARQYSQYMENAQAGLDQWTVLAHASFVVSGLYSEVSLTHRETMTLQLALKVKPTGRYGLATAKAVKKLQQELHTQALYSGPIDGLWNSKLQTAWELHKRSQGRYGVIIEEFGTKYGFDPRATILMPSLVESLWAPDSLWVGHDQLRKFLDRSKSQDPVIQIGLTFKDGKLVPVFAMPGGKFMEDVGWKIRRATMLKEGEKEFSNAAKQVGQELVKAGVTPENYLNKGEQLYELYTSIELILLLYGVVRKVAGKGAIRLLKEIFRKGRSETWEQARERIYGNLAKSKLVILRKGTNSFTLKPEALKKYPKVAGVWKPTGQFSLVEKPLRDRLSNIARRPSFKKAFKEWWLKCNPGKKWDDKWALHHVKPLKWGGDNEFKNLVPLLTKEHNKLTSFWNKLMYEIAGLGVAP